MSASRRNVHIQISALSLSLVSQHYSARKRAILAAPGIYEGIRSAIQARWGASRLVLAGVFGNVVSTTEFVHLIIARDTTCTSSPTIA